MKSWLCAGIVMMGTVVAQGAEGGFLGALRPEDFAAAGLAKLSPEERGRLEALVRDYKTGALAAAQRKAAEAERAAAAARARAEQAERQARTATANAAQASAGSARDNQGGPSLLDRARVLLKPGTKVEYTTLESQLVGDFNGWQRNTVFTLANGQRWRAVGDSSYVTPPMPPPKVRIEPGLLGTFWMTFEGVRSRAKVESLDASR